MKCRWIAAMSFAAAVPLTLTLGSAAFPAAAQASPRAARPDVATASPNAAGYQVTPKGGLASASVTFKMPTITCTSGYTQEQPINFGVTNGPVTPNPVAAFAQASCTGATAAYSFVVETKAGLATSLTGLAPGNTVVASIFQSGTTTEAEIHDLTSNTYWASAFGGNEGDTAAQIGAFEYWPYEKYEDNFPYFIEPIPAFSKATMSIAEVNGDFLGFDSPVEHNLYTEHTTLTGTANKVLVATGALKTGPGGSSFGLTFKRPGGGTLPGTST